VANVALASGDTYFSKSGLLHW